MDVLLSFAWILWAVLVLVFLVVEMFTLEMTFLMLAVGAAAALLAGLLGAPFWLQLIVAAVVALVAVLTLRPPLLRRLRRGGEHALTNVDALPGMSGVVLGELSGQQTGTVRLANGETWTAQLAQDGTAARVQPGSSVVVRSIHGATAIVSPQDVPMTRREEGELP